MIAAKDSALQQHREAAAVHGPRPLPLFLDMVQRVAGPDRELARRALAGIHAYTNATRPERPHRPIIAAIGRVSLLDGGGAGVPVVLVPSLINPSWVLDLAPGNSLCEWLANAGYRPLLVDWGDPAQLHPHDSLADHITEYLVPLVAGLGQPVHLVGYCLGGTMALASCRLLNLRSLTLLATPWHFDRYGDASRVRSSDLWHTHQPAVSAMGCMPVEVLQALFWAADEERAVAKYAAIAGLDPADPMVTSFAALEDWSNSGAPLTAAAARDLFEHLIAGNQSGTGVWRVGASAVGLGPAGSTPALHFTATNDHIAPTESAPQDIKTRQCPSGHVGMVVGSRARTGLWQPMLDWLAQN